MKKATKSDIYFIQQNPEGLGVGELAKATGLSNSQVKNLMTKQVVDEITSVPNIESQWDKSVAKHKTRKGVLMMTEGASQLIDETRSSNKPKDTSSFITKAKR